MLIDTHCHIHWSDYPIDPDEVVGRARKAGVEQMICVGTDEDDSKNALQFAEKYDGVFASVGVHPHYADKGIDGLVRLADSVYSGNGFVPGSIRASAPNRTRAADVTSNKGVQQDSATVGQKLIAIGETGLDYFYSNSARQAQIEILQQQIELALKYDLPIIFHVRDAFDDFWPVFDNFHGIRGVLHCFTDTVENAEKGLERGLLFGINGISTFTKDDQQKVMFASLPLDRVILETDSPLLTPNPFRGRVNANEPAFVKEIAQHYCASHQIKFDEVADITTANARALFKL